MLTKTIYKYFRRYLKIAGIGHKGRGCGPRLHDLRVTFAVHSLQHLTERGFWVIGDAYEEYLAAELTTRNPDEYITKIAIPVKEAKNNFHKDNSVDTNI